MFFPAHLQDSAATFMSAVRVGYYWIGPLMDVIAIDHAEKVK